MSYEQCKLCCDLTLRNLQVQGVTIRTIQTFGKNIIAGAQLADLSLLASPVSRPWWQSCLQFSCKTSIVSFRRNGKLGVYFGTLKLELVGLVDNAWQTEQLWVVNQVFGFRQMLVKWWIFVLAALPVLLNKSSLSQSNYLGEFNTKLNFSMSFAVICWNEVKSFKAKTLHNFRHKNF